MKHFKLFHYIMLLFIGISMSACFDIQEEYVFNADGSGKAKFTIDLTKMVELMDAFSELDSTGEAKNSLDEMFNDVESVTALKMIPGIRNVQNLTDKEAKVIGYSYEFDDLEALNNALAAANSSSDFTALGIEGDASADSGSENFFSKKGKKLIRSIKLPTPTDESEEDAQYRELAASMFADSYYRINYAFENPIKKVGKNDNAVLSADKKSVSVEVPMADFMNGKGNLGTEITLKK